MTTLKCPSIQSIWSFFGRLSARGANRATLMAVCWRFRKAFGHVVYKTWRWRHGFKVNLYWSSWHQVQNFFFFSFTCVTQRSGNFKPGCKLLLRDAPIFVTWLMESSTSPPMFKLWFPMSHPPSPRTITPSSQNVTTKRWCLLPMESVSVFGRWLECQQVWWPHPIRVSGLFFVLFSLARTCQTHFLLLARKWSNP